MSKEVLKVPKLRFKEFSGEWEETLLGNLLKEYTEKSKVDKEYPVLTSSLTKGLLPQTEYFENSRYENKDTVGFNIIPPNYITYRSRSDNGNFIFNINKLGYTGIISIYYPVFNINNGNNKFFIECFNRNPYFFYNYAVGTSQKVLSFNIIKNTIVPYPSLPEQKKIADFLSKVDEKIEKLTKKKDLLEQYKKGAMQKVFSQELRFKADNGNDFPEWEEKKFEELYSFKTTNSLSRENLNYKYGLVKNIHYGDIHTTFRTRFDVIKENVPYINSEIDLSRISDENYIKEGDLLIADASENYDDIGKTIEVINTNDEKILGGLHTLLAKPITDKMYLGFPSYLMKSYKVYSQIRVIAQGAKVLGLSTTRVNKIVLDIPSLLEQQKIADFLSALDKKIDIVNKELAGMQEFKKGLLQQMFV